MTELSKELLKNINKDKQNETEIAEEMADVYILLEQLKDIYNILEDKLSQIACEKFQRWKKTIMESFFCFHRAIPKSNIFNLQQA